jgi:predicted PurR-regulated permease PerM
MGDSRTPSNTPSSRLLTRASESTGLLRRLFTTGFFVAGSAVFVVTLRLWCVVFAGLLLGVFLQRISQVVERRTPLGYRPAVGCVLAAGVLLSIAAIYLVAPRFGEQLGNLSSTLTAAAERLMDRVSQWGWADNVADQAPQVGGRMLSGLDTTAILGGVFSSITGTAAALLLVLFVVSQVLLGILVGIEGVAIATPLAAVVLQLVRELYVQEPKAVPIDSTSPEPA